MFYPEFKNKTDSETENLVIRLKDHARNLYETRQFLCTEAVLVALNQGLDGGLTEDQAVTMGAPFCVAMGDSGCLCGALSGAVLATGLLMGKNRPYTHRKEMRESGMILHNTFKAVNGATCCRVLSKKVKHDKKAHFKQCANLTAEAAEMAVRLILEKRPDLIPVACSRPRPRHHCQLSGLAVKLFKRIF
ncbi:C-GCAxxG-C-C family protein [Desulfobacula sp.]|uniref:C-GCAxxG-C-C family protein n=1 Tax=Desulfobacula sp. TaxID=2593537 RepID=UPI002610F228|nr:C-GCAxxG-C-C family protein [Desulfobacula sp.]